MEPAEEEETGAAGQFSLVVAADGTIDLEYPICTVPGVADSLCQVVCVAVVGDRLLVAFPSTVWNRKANKRLIPSKYLQKPAGVHVPCCHPDKRDDMDPEAMMKVWMGFLSQDGLEVMEQHDSVPDVEHEFGAEMEDNALLPFAQGLVDAAQEHFAFLSAREGEQEEPVPVESGGVEERVSKLEDLMQTVAKDLETLVGGLQPTAALPVKPKSKVKTAKPKLPTTDENKFPLLDPGVVAASLAAGIEEESLEQMQKLLAAGAKGAKKLQEPPVRKSALRKTNELSESEEEEAQAVTFAPTAASSSEPIDTVSQAVKQLTQIVVQLAEDKGKKSKASDLENALDAVGSSTEGVAGVTSGKKAAAARRALRSALVSAPEDLSGLIEKLMYEDITSTTLPPGMPRPKISARAWVEHRSRIGSYRTSAHAAWGIAGVLDELYEGRYQSARARANLMLLQLDQAAVDKGNWLLAGELALENLPPYSRLALHTPPMVADGERPYSRLLDDRWAEICLSHLKETEDFLTKRKNLSQRKPEGGIRDGGEDVEVEPKRKVRPRPKQKALPEVGDA